MQLFLWGLLQIHESSYDDEFIVLDVRTSQERANGFLANSTHIDFYDEAFLDKLNLLDKTKPIYVYCMVGGRSSKACSPMPFGHHNFGLFISIETSVNLSSLIRMANLLQ